VRENAHDYFLSAKARYQNSGDIEDAADLYFAVKNMAEHGHEVEWDSTLQKMEQELVNVPDPEGELERDGVRYREIAVPAAVAQQAIRAYPALNPAAAGSETERGGHLADDTRDRKRPWMSFGKWRSHISGTDMRRANAEPACSDFPGGEFEKLLEKKTQAPGLGQPGKTYSPYHTAIESLDHPLAKKENIGAIRELRASRPRPIEDMNNPDEFSLQGWFIETSRDPKVYDHLLDYYHPDSPFYVKSETHGDRRLDNHAKEITEQYLPSRTSRAADRPAVKNLIDSGQALFDLDDKEDRERLNLMRENLGIYAPGVIGQADVESRTRLYESRYQNWLKAYNHLYPQSPMPEDALRKMFLDHLMLEIDGMPSAAHPETGMQSTLGPISIWDLLYKEDGSPKYALPKPGARNRMAGYKQISSGKDYHLMRDRRNAMGFEALRAGLLMVSPAIADRLLLADQQYKWLQAFQRSPKEVKKYLLGPEFWKQAKDKVQGDLAEMFLSELIDDETGEEKVIDFHGAMTQDGKEASTFLIPSLTRYMEGHRLVMNTAMGKFMKNSTDTPHESDQPLLHPQASNLTKECLQHMLKTADWQTFGDPNHPDREQEGLEARDTSRQPLHRKLYAASTHHSDDGEYDWDTSYGIPHEPWGNKLETFHDLIVFLNEANRKNLISNDDLVKMLIYADHLHDGSRAYSIRQGVRERDFSSKRRSMNLKTATPLLHSVWGTPSSNRDATNLENEFEATPFAPTHKRLTKEGGLNFHAQDLHVVFAQRNIHEFRAVTPEMLGISDYRPILRPYDPDTGEGDRDYDEFIRGLGEVDEKGGPGLGMEFREAQRPGALATKKDILTRPDRFPRLHQWVLRNFPSFTRDTFSERELARADAAGVGSAADLRGEELDAWNNISVEDILRNVLIDHTRNLLLDTPHKEGTVMDSVKLGALRELFLQQLPDDVAEGSLGYLPVSPAHFGQYATLIPPWVAVNIALLEHVLPPSRRMDPDHDGRGKTAKENIEKRLRNMVKLKEKYMKEGSFTQRFGSTIDVPPPRSPLGTEIEADERPDPDSIYSPHFHPYWQGVVLNMASMFYMGRHDTMLNSTLYPLLAAQMALSHEHGHGVKSLGEGDGSGMPRGGSGGEAMLSASFLHRKLGQARQIQNEAWLKDFEAKHAASLWGLGGTPPLSYGPIHGDDHDGKSVLTRHLSGDMDTSNDPYLQMVRKMNRRRTLAVPGHFTEHRTLYTPSGTMNDLFAMLASRESKGGEHETKLGRKYSNIDNRWVSDQPIGIQPHWKDLLDSPQLSGTDKLGPHWYKLDDNGHLPLQEIEDGTGLYGPLNFLNDYSLTRPLEGGWDHPAVASDMNAPGDVRMFDLSLIGPGVKRGDLHYIPMEDSEYSSHAESCQSCLGEDFQPTGFLNGAHPSDGAPVCDDCHGTRKTGWVLDENRDRDDEQKWVRAENAKATMLYHLLHNNHAQLPNIGTLAGEQVLRDIDPETGEHWVLGPHPAQLVSQWADNAMSFAPSSENMRRAIAKLNEEAAHSVLSIAEVQPDNDPDIMYRAGVKVNAHHLSVRNHMNAAHALRVGWPIVEAIMAAQKFPDIPLSEAVEDYREKYLQIHEGTPDIRDRRALIYYILKHAHDFMSGLHPEQNRLMMSALSRAIMRENNPASTERWKETLEKAGVALKDDGDWNYVPYRTHAPLGAYKHTRKQDADTHPLTRFTGTENKDHVLGRDILLAYLMPREEKLGDTEVSKALREEGHDPMDIVHAIGSLSEKFPMEDEKGDDNYPRGGRPDTYSKAISDIDAVADAKQHVKGLHPDMWFRGIKGKTAQIEPQVREKYGRGGFRYQDQLIERGRHSRRALHAMQWAKEQIEDGDEDSYIHDLSPLFRLMPIIKRDLESKYDKDKQRAFAVHNHALEPFMEARDDTSQMQGFMRFLFAQGHYSDVHDYGNTEVIPGGQRPRVGYHHSDTSSVPSKVDFSRAKLSSHLFNPMTLKQFGVELPESMQGSGTFDTLQQNRYLEFHPDVLNDIVGMPIDQSMGNNFEQTPAAQDIARGSDLIKTSMDALTDLDLLLKSEKGEPVPVKAMHRIFDIDDLEYFKGFSGDWVLSSWPVGERLMVTRKSNLVKAKDSHNETFTLSNEVKKDVRAAHDANFVIDCIWDGEVLHIVDILKTGDEDMENEHTKHRIRHLRANFSATENVSIPAPVNTKRVDTEGLRRGVKDLFKERGVKQVLLRDADSTYMKGETRHPKWVLMTKEKQVDVIILESTGGATLLGVGPLVDEDAKKMGNRSKKYKDEYYMDVGTIPKSGLQQGKFITVKTSNVTCKVRKGLKIFTLHGAKYVRDSESQAADSLKTLELLSGENSENVPHKLRVSKGSVHLEFPIGHVVYDTEPFGHSFIVKSVDAPSPYMATLAESQREYWEPLAAVFLRAEVEAKKAKKANVVPEPPANHDKKPKKVLKPSERLLKDPKLVKQLMTVLETAENLLKEKVTFTGPKGLGIDFATPVESPSGPTDNTEPYNLPDHDPAHRQEKGGDCWCGAKKGQMCEQGTGVKINECPRFSPPKKEKGKKHIKIDVS